MTFDLPLIMNTFQQIKFSNVSVWNGGEWAYTLFHFEKHF